MRLVENIPLFSIFIMMAGGIVTPLLGGGNRARVLHMVLVGAVAVMSGLLLGYTSDGTCFCFMMGHFPAPWGNEVRAGALEALMSLVFSLVMFLTVAANKRSLEHDIPSERAGLYYVMMNLLFSSLLALVYTNDLFTASPEVIITRAILRGNKSFPEDAKSLTFPAMGSISRWPVWQYKRAMEIRIRPLPTRLMIR